MTILRIKEISGSFGLWYKLFYKDSSDILQTKIFQNRSELDRFLEAQE